MWASPWQSLERAVLDACVDLADELKRKMPAPGARITWMSWFTTTRDRRLEVPELAVLGLHRW